MYTSDIPIRHVFYTNISWYGRIRILRMRVEITGLHNGRRAARYKLSFSIPTIIN